MSWSTTLLEFLCDRKYVTKSGVRLHLLHPSFQTFIECHGHKYCRVRECHCGDFGRYFVFSSGGHSPITNTTLWFFPRTRTKPSAFFICATFIIVWGGKCWNFEESEQINNLITICISRKVIRNATKSIIRTWASFWYLPIWGILKRRRNCLFQFRNWWIWELPIFKHQLQLPFKLSGIVRLLLRLLGEIDASARFNDV